jgi:hypothetical protein
MPDIDFAFLADAAETLPARSSMSSAAASPESVGAASRSDIRTWHWSSGCA